MEKPPNEIRAIDLVMSKIKRINANNEIVDAMDLSKLGDITNFIEHVIYKLNAIENLLNNVNNKLTILTSNE